MAGAFHASPTASGFATGSQYRPPVLSARLRDSGSSFQPTNGTYPRLLRWLDIKPGRQFGRDPGDTGLEACSRASLAASSTAVFGAFIGGKLAQIFSDRCAPDDAAILAFAVRGRMAKARHRLPTMLAALAWADGWGRRACNSNARAPRLGRPSDRAEEGEGAHHLRREIHRQTSIRGLKKNSLPRGRPLSCRGCQMPVVTHARRGNRSFAVVIVLNIRAELCVRQDRAAAGAAANSGYARAEAIVDRLRDAPALEAALRRKGFVPVWREFSDGLAANQVARRR